MSLTIACANLDFARRGDKALIRDACMGADGVGFVETIRGGKGLPVDLASFVPEGWRALHDTTDAATSGVAMAYHPDALEVHAWRWVPVSKLPGLRRRGALIVDATDRETGGRGTFAWSHFPPPRTPLGRKIHAAALRKILAKHAAVLFGGDVNMRPADVGDLLGLDSAGHEVMAFAWGGGVTVGKVRKRAAKNTDHPIISAQVRLPVPQEAPAMTTIIEAREWGANAAKDATPSSHPIGSTLGVTLHWTGNAMGIKSHADCDDRVRGIERSHEYGNGWADIAYNLLVCPHGYIYEGRGPGVRSSANGSTQSNEDWYAVCYLGGTGEPFTDAGKAGMIEAVRYLRWAGKAGPRVNGHRDHKATTCPGAAIYAWLQSANFDSASQPAPAPTPAPTPKRHPKFIRQELRHLRALRKKAKAAGKKVRAGRLGKLIRTARDLFPKR